MNSTFREGQLSTALVFFFMLFPWSSAARLASTPSQTNAPPASVSSDACHTSRKIADGSKPSYSKSNVFFLKDGGQRTEIWAFHRASQTQQRIFQAAPDNYILDYDAYEELIAFRVATLIAGKLIANSIYIAHLGNDGKANTGDQNERLWRVLYANTDIEGPSITRVASNLNFTWSLPKPQRMEGCYIEYATTKGANGTCTGQVQITRRSLPTGMGFLDWFPVPTKNVFSARAQRNEVSFIWSGTKSTTNQHTIYHSTQAGSRPVILSPPQYNVRADSVRSFGDFLIYKLRGPLNAPSENSSYRLTLVNGGANFWLTKAVSRFFQYGLRVSPVAGKNQRIKMIWGQTDHTRYDLYLNEYKFNGTRTPIRINESGVHATEFDIHGDNVVYSDGGNVYETQCFLR